MDKQLRTGKWEDACCQDFCGVQSLNGDSNCGQTQSIFGPASFKFIGCQVDRVCCLKSYLSVRFSLNRVDDRMTCVYKVRL
jgi:hypothetical protein